MLLEADSFNFKASPVLSRARRVLIKPSAGYTSPYPVTTSRELLASIVKGIRQISDADIILLEGTPGGSPVQPVYKALEYDFPRVLAIDVNDCNWVEVDNPLPKPLAMPTFWVPNVILSSDYLITTTPLRVTGGQAWLSIPNLLSVLPASKYGGENGGNWAPLYSLGIDRVLADLYFTLPFDLAIIEGRQILVTEDAAAPGKGAEYGKMFVGEPYEVDNEVSQALGLRTAYLELINAARTAEAKNI